MTNQALQQQTHQDAKNVSNLLNQAETALAINDYEKATLLLVSIAELKEKQNESSTELADAYFDVGNAYFKGAAHCSDKYKAQEYYLRSWYYVALAKVHYPPQHIDPISVCNKLISYIDNNQYLATNAINAPIPQLSQCDIELLALYSEALPSLDDGAKVQEKPKVKLALKDKVTQEEDYLSEKSSVQDDNEHSNKKKKSKAKAKQKYNETRKSTKQRFQYRSALVEGELIKSVSIKERHLMCNLDRHWGQKSHFKALKKMFGEISRTRPLFREHLKIARGLPLRFLIIKPIDNPTPEMYLDFIRQQAKTDLPSFVMVKLKQGGIISHVEVDGKFAVFHVLDQYQTPEELFKINSALYNNFLCNKLFKANFGAPTKNKKMPTMKIKKPIQGLSATEILNKLISILNKKVAANLQTDPLDEQSMGPLTPLRSSTSTNTFLPSLAPNLEPELESQHLQTSLMPFEPVYNQDDFATLFGDQGVYVQPPLTYQYNLNTHPLADVFAEEDNNFLRDWRAKI